MQSETFFHATHLIIGITLTALTVEMILSANFESTHPIILSICLAGCVIALGVSVKSQRYYVMTYAAVAILMNTVMMNAQNVNLFLATMIVLSGAGAFYAAYATGNAILEDDKQTRTTSPPTAAQIPIHEPLQP